MKFEIFSLKGILPIYVKAQIACNISDPRNTFQKRTSRQTASKEAHTQNGSKMFFQVIGWLSASQIERGWAHNGITSEARVMMAIVRNRYRTSVCYRRLTSRPSSCNHFRCDGSASTFLNDISSVERARSIADMAPSGSVGGALKLKGAKPTGIDKKAKKKKRVEVATESNRNESDVDNPHEERAEEVRGAAEEQRERLAKIQKTESERRFEETRRKRVRRRCTLEFHL